MDKDLYKNVAVYTDDYNRIKERLSVRRGTTMMGLIHELLERTEPKHRVNGRFATKQGGADNGTGTTNSD